MTRHAQPCRRGRSPRGDQGLAKLSWLLLAAAVAGLAVVLVQTYVEDTPVVLVQTYVEDAGERMANPGLQATAAIEAASEVEINAKAAPADGFDSWDDWERHFSQQCSLIAVLYSNAGVEVVHSNFTGATGATTFDPAAAAAADELPAGPGKAQVQCVVG